MAHPDEMVRVAAKRGVVKLVDGRTARLLFWPTKVPASEGYRVGRRTRARVQLASGAVLTVQRHEVAGVVDE